MIHAVYSTDERFKRLDLNPGLNILLAERRPDAADTDTRNGAGKSSLIALIHFVLGGNIGKKSIFTSEALINAGFGLDLDVGPERRLASRSGATPSTTTTVVVSVAEKAGVEDGEDEAPDGLGVGDGPNGRGDPTYETGEMVLPGMETGPVPERIKTSEWLNVLRTHWYSGLPEEGGPTTRTLLTYAARQAAGGGFEDPFKIVNVQSASDYQVAVSYLLDLDWTISDAWKDVRKREKNVKALTSALRSGELKSFTIGSVAKLRTQVSLAERRVAELRAAAANFQVIPSFAQLELEANRISGDIRRNIDDNAIDRALLDQLRETFQTESSPAADDVVALYEAAGIQLGELVRRRFEEVSDFHASVVTNRAHHLEQEIALTEARITQREQENIEADRRRGELLRTLQAGGALETLTALQAEIATEQGKLENLRGLYRTADELETGKAGAKQARQTLHVQLRQDLREREGQLADLIGRFEEFSTRLYDERVGSLEIDADENGPTFAVEIHGGTSRGIAQMQVFCFDLLVAEVSARRGVGPGFLVHDSHLFDGVDERQIGRGLALAAEVSEAAGFQYIVTMNSDDLPTTLPDGFDLTSHFLPVVLTDAHEDGGLFGFRFDSIDDVPSDDEVEDQEYGVSDDEVEDQEYGESYDADNGGVMGAGDDTESDD
jgi:uncharacterized protein YydD (DUF2326 family)